MKREASSNRPRPKKGASTRAKRVPVTLRMTFETKQRLDDSAKESGLSQSAEIEALVLRALNYDETLRGMRTTVREIAKGNIEEAFRKAGYIIIQRTAKGGKVWGPAEEFPQLQSGFREPAED
jgi:hypothetical protein